MKKTHYIFFILFCGFLLTPIDSYACNSFKQNTSKIACCELTKDSQHENNKQVEKSCCKKANSEKKSCDGSCNSSNCNFSPIFSSIIIAETFSILQKSEIIATIKPNFFYLEKNISLNYLAIWSPPKIS